MINLATDPPDWRHASETLDPAVRYTPAQVYINWELMAGTWDTSVTELDARMDNLGVEYYQGYFYRVSDYLNSPDWTDVTTSEGVQPFKTPDNIPAFFETLYVDPYYPDHLVMIGGRGFFSSFDSGIFISNDQGANWVEIPNIGFNRQTVNRLGSTLIACVTDPTGYGYISYSPDLGQTIENKTGNWESVFPEFPGT